MEAPSKEAWFEKMNVPYDSIVPVELEGDSGTVKSA
jgi:hypothetical protein